MDIKEYINRKRYGIYSLRDMSIKVSYFIVLIIFIPMLFPSGRSLKYTDLTKGSIVNKKVIAPFTFPVLKTDDVLQKERNEAANKVPYYFNYNRQIVNQELNRLKNHFEFLANLPTDLDLNDTIYVSADKSTKIDIDSIFSKIYVDFKPGFSAEEIKSFRNYLKTKPHKVLFYKISNILTEIYNNKIISIPKMDMINNKIVFIDNGIEEEINSEEVYDLIGAQQELIKNLKDIDNNNLLIKLSLSHLKPNLLFNKELTDQRKNEAIGSVALSVDLVYEDERIIDANERVTDEIFDKLRSLEIALAEKSLLEGDWQNFLSHFGKYLLTFLILLILFIYILKNRPHIFKDNNKLILINLIIFLQVGIGAIIVGPLGWSPYLIPTTISCMLLGILFDVGIGLIVTAVIGLIMGGILGLDYTIATMTVISGIVAIYSVSKIRTRNQIFKAIIFIILAYSATLLAFNSLRYEEISETLKAFLYFILPNAILSPFITYMSLGVFEKIFDITTDVTLLELSDMNHPLLKQLANKAPGTFHHSIVVGNLAESAAKEIQGANSLLARVGSYYHDIGKMKKSEYFVENQKGIENKHNSLAPNMSALILSAHVKNGLELGKEYNLPKKIRDFIPEHHGRNVMSYFYDKALKEKDAKEVNIEDYRYPGPKPQTKETAIVMLADTVEAAAKTLKSPTPGRLRKLVTDLVEKKFLEGELEDCNLTMRDLKGIVEGFVSVLIGIYHERIEYPDDNTKKSDAQKKVEPLTVNNKNENSDNIQ